MVELSLCCPWLGQPLHGMPGSAGAGAAVSPGGLSTVSAISSSTQLHQTWQLMFNCTHATVYTKQHCCNELVMLEDCKVHKVWKMFDCSKKSVWNILRCVWVVMQGREMNDHHVWMSTPGPGGGTLAAEQLQLDQLISDEQRENYIYKSFTFFCL